MKVIDLLSLLDLDKRIHLVDENYKAGVNDLPFIFISICRRDAINNPDMECLQYPVLGVSPINCPLVPNIYLNGVVPTVYVDSSSLQCFSKEEEDILKSVKREDTPVTCTCQADNKAE